MAITIAKTVANVLARGGSVFISDDEGVTWYDMGRQKGAKIDGTAVETEIDTAGRTVQLAMDVVLTTVLTQTADSEFVNTAAMNAIAANGAWIKFTSIFTNAAGAGAAAGFTFKNVFPVFGAMLMFDNTESYMPMSAKGRVNMADWAGLGTTQDLTFDG